MEKKIINKFAFQDGFGSTNCVDVMTVRFCLMNHIFN